MTDIKLAEAQCAERAYKAYGHYVGWKNYAGADMPTWEGLPDNIKGAWRAACAAAVLFERGLLENGAGGVGIQ